MSDKCKYTEYVLEWYTIFKKVKQDNGACKDGNNNNNNKNNNNDDDDNNNNNRYNDLEVCVVENIYVVFWSELILATISAPKGGTNKNTSIEGIFGWATVQSTRCLQYEWRCYP